MGKRQAFINLYRAGGGRKDFIALSNSYGVKDPFEALTLYDMLMSGALPSELKHGGIASLAPRKRYAQGIGPVGEGKSFPTNSKMPTMDPYKLFFMYQNKLMRDKKKEGLAEILGV
jgi:hypothetical protein